MPEVGRSAFRDGRAAVAVAAVLSGLSGVPAAAGGVSPERADELERLVRHDCGSCHGMRLSGGLGPDIRPGALDGIPAETVTAIILDGLEGTAMPPWRPLISEEDAQWIAVYLKDARAE